MKNRLLPETRREMLAMFVKEKSLTVASKLLGKPDRQLNDMIAGRKSFGDKVARDMEVVAIRNGELWAYYFDGISNEKISIPTIDLYENLSNSISLPILNVHGSMGNGNEMNNQELVVEVLRVSKSWVDKTLGVITGLDNLSFIHAIGDSMLPTFNDGDILLVDSGVKNVSSDSVYVLCAHDRLFIKRVRRRMDGSFEISSDNPAVKTVDVLNGNHDVEIKGRVVWVWNGKKV